MTHTIQLHTFHGGIHPAENKSRSTTSAIRSTPLANELVLPLQQHIGAPASVCVAVGEQVFKGQLIANPQGFVSLPIHAPTSGEIIAIEPRAIPHVSGLQELCVVLRPDGKDEWIRHQGICAELGVEDISSIPAARLTDCIRMAGIAGMGGAGFPSAVKLAVKRDEQGNSPIHTLILNGAECEPYITSDDMLMRERAAEVVRGAQILLYILGAKRCLIGVEDNKPEAIAALNQALIKLHEEHHIDVVNIPTKYPSGGEKQLIKILTGEEVPSGGIPANIGIVCQNVASAAAVHRAIDLGEPLISRITTVTGDAITNPGNWEVALGTPVSHLLQLAGYQPQKIERVIMGGPMMGFTLPGIDLPLVKTSNCLLAPTPTEMPLNDMAMACIRCGMCTQACPVELLPQQLYWFSRAEEFEKAEQHNLFDCIECGACSYVCPSQIPLVQYYRHAKGSIREEKAALKKSEQAKERYERRLARQEREAAEKEAKRKARADAASKTQSAKPAEPAAIGTAVTSGTSELLEKLQKQLTATQTAITKTKDKLAEAQAAVTTGDDTQASKIHALETGLAKSMAKMKDLAKDIAAEKKALKAAAAVPAGHADTSASTTDKGDPNSPERLQRKWETAKARLDTAQKRLAEAREQGLDTVAILEDGVQKQQARVDEAKVAWKTALKGETPAPAVTIASAADKPADNTVTAANTPADSGVPSTGIPSTGTASTGTASEEVLNSLRGKILAAQDRATKAQERLDMAREQNLPTIDALAGGLAKQQDKVAQLQQQLAELETAAAATPTTSGGTL
jgi:Na+-translocating ferredoxin:NAD+ oxidoreductase subunit C